MRGTASTVAETGIKSYNLWYNYQCHAIIFLNFDLWITMKKLTAYANIFAIAVIAFSACTSKKAGAAREWKEMDDFHMVMAETFHPYKDSADLGPVRAKAAELTSSAEKWATAPLPEKVDNDEMRTRLQQLRSEAEALEDIVAAGTDQEIGAQLTRVHDLFHSIQETWYSEGENHEHHE